MDVTDVGREASVQGWRRESRARGQLLLAFDGRTNEKIQQDLHVLSCSSRGRESEGEVERVGPRVGERLAGGSSFHTGRGDTGGQRDIDRRSDGRGGS